MAVTMTVTGGRLVISAPLRPDADPVEVFEAFERMLAAWPDARIPVKQGAQPGAVCGCGTDHGGWTCAHCTPR